MKINVIDPGFFGPGGHHFEINRGICEQYISQGHGVCLYTHRSLPVSVENNLRSIVEVKPIFSISPYKKSREIDPIAGEFIFFQRQVNQLSKEFQLVRSADVSVFPTLFPAQLVAYSSLHPDSALSGCIHDVPEARGDEGAIYWRYAFIQADKRNVQKRLGVLEPELKYRYQPLLNGLGQIEELPIPFDGMPIESKKVELKRIGFFGHQRPGKDQLAPMPIATRLAEMGFEIIVQSTTGKNAGSDPKIRTMGYVENLAEAIAQCDLVIVPYSAEKYRFKGSGILWEALASGVPVLAPYGSAPGRWIEKSGAGGVFLDHSADSIVTAVRLIQEDFGVVSEKAHQFAKIWPEKHGIARFSRHLIAQF